VVKVKRTNRTKERVNKNVNISKVLMENVLRSKDSTKRNNQILVKKNDKRGNLRDLKNLTSIFTQ
jgi:hypothetical protein